MPMSPGDFGYDLPDNLIAHYPPVRRRDSRLMSLHADSGNIDHLGFQDFPGLLRAEDLLVFNDTRVIPARLFGHKESGGKVEVLLERMLEGNRMLAQVRASKSPAAGSLLYLGDGKESLCVEVCARQDDFYLLQFDKETDLGEALEKHGHIPLPPYIRRDSETLDRERYQTVYARRDGAVAAPTAGLHFDEEIMAEIANKGVASCFVTLHVGAGTFQPIRVKNIEDHRMHKELVEVSQEVCDQVRACKERGGRVIAIGTTSVRSLESAAHSGELKAMKQETDIFIYPGYEFRIVDAMLTNFHLPESTLIMLVSAFCKNKDILMNAYREAVAESYRFFSYGDAMFIHR